LRPGVPTLCFPDGEKSCFACCPPIRPAHYEHLQFRRSVERMLLENTQTFPQHLKRPKPIVGFSCWALGYVDRQYRQIGCLLHPAQNRGQDLRHLAGYAEKCRNEWCPASRVFARLSLDEKAFWLELAKGLDSFAYSSSRQNPLFTLMGWGADILSAVACREKGKPMGRKEIFQTYPVLGDALEPRRHAYPLRRILEERGIDRIKGPDFLNDFRRLSALLAERLPDASPESSGDPAVHRLGLDADFLDFLRLFAGIKRIGQKEAEALQFVVDETVIESSASSCGRS